MPRDCSPSRSKASIPTTARSSSTTISWTTASSTRSPSPGAAPEKKNDGCYVEQKNWARVRELVGYYRYDSTAELDQLNQTWALDDAFANYSCLRSSSPRRTVTAPKSPSGTTRPPPRINAPWRIQRFVSELPTDNYPITVGYLGVPGRPSEAQIAPTDSVTVYTRKVRVRPIDLVDIFVYLVVIGVFIELFPEIITETFLLALLTAVLLKVVLEVVLWVKKSIVGRLRGATSAFSRVISAIILVLVLPGSKFLVLELVAFFFGGAVSLGGFFQVTALIVVPMLARGGMRRMFERDLHTEPGCDAPPAHTGR